MSSRSTPTTPIKLGKLTKQVSVQNYSSRAVSVGSPEDSNSLQALPSLKPIVRQKASSNDSPTSDRNASLPLPARSRSTGPDPLPNSWVERNSRTSMVWQDLHSTVVASPLPPGSGKMRRLQDGLAQASSELSASLESLQASSKAHELPLFDVFKGAWNNYELYIEHCAKPGSYNLQAMGKRATTMDFSEMLELLKSLNLLPEREGFVDPNSKIPQAIAHDVFRAVNYKLFKEFHATAGKRGHHDQIEMIFDEYKMVMLTLAAYLNLDIDALVEGSDMLLDESYKKSIHTLAR
jgi:hypothetical protein